MTLTPEAILSDQYLMAFEKKVTEEDNDFAKEGMPLPELDVELLRQHFDWAKKSREVPDNFQLQWEQEHWLYAPELKTEQLGPEGVGGSTTKVPFATENFCRTAGCIAGAVALQFGEPVWYNDASEDERPRYLADYVKTDDGVMDIANFAAQKLGLTWEESKFMFYAGCTLDQIEHIAARACERRGLRW